MSRHPSHFSQHPDHSFSFGHKEHPIRHVSLYPVHTPLLAGEKKYSWYSLPPTTTENRNPANVCTNTRTFSPQKYFNHKSNDSWDTLRHKRVQIDKNRFSPTYENDKAVDKHSPVDTCSVSKRSAKSLGSDPQDQTEKPVNLVVHQNPGHTHYPDKNYDGDHEITEGSDSVDYSHVYDEFNVKNHDMSVTQNSSHN